MSLNSEFKAIVIAKSAMNAESRRAEAKKRRGIVGFAERCFDEILPKRHCEGGNGLPTEAIRLISQTLNQIAGLFRAPHLCISVNCRMNSPKPDGRTSLTSHNDSHGKISQTPLPVKHLFPYSPIHLLPSKKVAFTLAEVLITLGIIGVVAALTIPSVVSSYKKSVVEHRLKKISSSLFQAYNLANAANGLDNCGNTGICREGFTPRDPDAALEMFNKYYVPYMNFVKVEKGSMGVFGYLNDGTAIYFMKTGYPQSWSNTYIVACITAKACQNITENAYAERIANGKDTFGFYISGLVPTYGISTGKSHEGFIADCKAQLIEACTVLIFEAGWKIPKDYPIKL